MCANCHDISNPFHATDRVHQAPQEYSPLERTFSEWQLSDFSSSADSITCQGCHMQQSPGYGSFFSSTPLRSDLRQHDLTGGNTFLADILPDFWSNLDSSTLAQGKQRAEATLQRAATLDVSTTKYPDSVIAVARVINLTGHKLPTGYPEGRRMWLNVVALNANGDTVFQSGEYDTSTATLSRDGQLKLYEIKFGLTDSMATRYGLTPGESFHFSLNDTILFDNRIPPKGFTNSKYVSRLASPVGYSYADSQYWDETRYLLPANAVRVTVNLFYQTISKEYIEFLRNENVDNSYDWNSWGDKLYTSWLTHGKSQPFVMATSTKTITGTKSGEGLPSSFKLYQNFPNPFNPSTDLKLENKNSGFVSLKIFDVLGNEIAVLLNEKKPPGSYTVTWNAAGQPSGIYFARCSLNGIEQTIKLVLVR